MKGIEAIHAKIAVGSVWESPPLHILLTFEDGLYIARCLDFLVSSHGDTKQEAFKSLAEAIKEYILTAAENNAWDTLFDPAHSKYWRLFNSLDSMQLFTRIKRSLSANEISISSFSQTPVKMSYTYA